MKALDTSVLVAAEKDARALARLRQEPSLVIPALAAAEFLVGIRLVKKETHRLRAQDLYDEEFRPFVMGFDESQAQTLASLIAENRRRGNTMKMFDAAIAAAAIDAGCPLIAADADFDAIKDLVTVERL